MTTQAENLSPNRAVDTLPIDLLVALPVAKISHRKGVVPIQALIALPDRRKKR